MLDETSDMKIKDLFEAEPLLSGRTETEITTQKIGINSGISVRRTSNQAITTATWTVVQFESIEFDLAGEYTNYKFTANENGYYLLNVSYGAFEGANWTALERAEVRAIKNGATTAGLTLDRIGSEGTATLPKILGGSRIYKLEAGDYIEIEVYQDSGGNLNLTELNFQVMRLF